MTSTSDIRRTVREIVIQENADAQIEDEDDYHADFVDIGVDSLGLMMTTLKVAEIYTVEFTEDTFDELKNIQDIVDFVKKHR